MSQLREPSSCVSSGDELGFPDLPAALTSRRRRYWQTCILRAISPLRRLGPTQDNAFGILTYHRVSDNAGPDPAMLNVSPARFRQQLAGLLQLGYTPVPLRSFVEQQHLGQTFKRRTFAVVFDDGFADIYHNAWPTLKELEVPATIFLATKYLDSTSKFPFDDWSEDSAATARPLSTDECREMLDSGFIDIGTHTHSHMDFRDKPAELRQDLEESLALLNERFAIKRPTLSFPYGFASSALADEARELGISCGLTADCQLVKHNDDPFTWGRFGATELDSPQSLAAKIDGWYSRCQNTWRRLRHRSSRV